MLRFPPRSFSLCSHAATWADFHFSLAVVSSLAAIKFCPRAPRNDGTERPFIYTHVNSVSFDRKKHAWIRAHSYTPGHSRAARGGTRQQIAPPICSASHAEAHHWGVLSCLKGPRRASPVSCFLRAKRFVRCLRGAFETAPPRQPFAELRFAIRSVSVARHLRVARVQPRPTMAFASAYERGKRLGLPWHAYTMSRKR